MTPEIQQHITNYRVSDEALRDYIKTEFPYGCVVRVNCQGRYCGLGRSSGPGSRADAVAVILENGNTWEYPIDTVTRPVHEDMLSKWMKEPK